MKSLFTNLFRRYLSKPHAPRKSASHRSRLTLEQLDQRILPAVTINFTSAGLTIVGTSGPAVVSVTESGGPSPEVVVNCEGQAPFTAIASSVQSITFQGTLGQPEVFQNSTSINATIIANGSSNQLSGGNGNDQYILMSGNDTIQGGNGNDMYVFYQGVTGNIAISDSGGNNTVNFSDFTAGVNVYLGTTVPQLVLGDSSLRLTLHGAFQNLYGGSGNDSLSAGTTGALLYGGPGDDTLIGGPGNDTLIGGGGNDSLQGGPGDDTYTFLHGDKGKVTISDIGGKDTLDFSDFKVGVTVNLANTTQNVRGDGSLQVTLKSTIENIIGGSGDDNLTGGKSGGILNGGPGNDTLTGGSGNETLIGGPGNDVLHGGSGKDIFSFDLSQNCGADSIVPSAQQGAQATLQIVNSASQLLFDPGIVGSPQVLSSNLTLTLMNHVPIIVSSVGGDVLNLGFITDTKLRSTFLADYQANNDQLTHANVLQLFQQVESEGANNSNTVTVGDYSILKDIEAPSSNVNMPDDVRSLMNKVVNHDVANSLVGGDLKLNRSVANLQALVNKWFYGTDNPESKDSYAFANPQAPLFQVAINTPVFGDVVQGAVGDCYLLAALAEVAAQQPSAIKSMFTDNGDGTYTVRYYVTSGKSLVPDYVTVDTAFPVNSHGNFVFANYDMSINGTAPLWVALAEKAYAELNEEGVLGANGSPGSYYREIASGNPGLALEQITGQVLVKNNNQFNPAAPFTNTTTTAFDNWERVTNTSFVVLGSFKANSNDKNGTDPNGVIPDHAYAVVGTTPNGEYTLYNPWGKTIELTQQQIDNSFAEAEWFIIPTNPSHS